MHSTEIVKYSSSIPFILNVTVVSGHELPNTHAISEPAYYVVLKLDGTEKKTNVSTKNDKSPTWGEHLKFHATISSGLQIQVFCTHPRTSTNDHIVGKAREDLSIDERLLHNQDIECALDVVNTKSSKNKERKMILRFKVDGFATHKSHDISPRSVDGPTSSLQVPKPGPEFRRMSENWNRLFDSLKSFCEVAKDIAEVNSKAKFAMLPVSIVVKIINDQIERDARIDDLVCALAGLFEWLQDGTPLDKINSFENTVKKLLHQTKECSYFIRENYGTYSFSRRALENIVSGVDEPISQFQAAFEQLRIELIMGTTLETALISSQILGKVQNIENKIYLGDLPRLHSMGFDPQMAAMPGSHCDPVIDYVLRWVAGTIEDESYKKHVLLLLGEKGCGKSSIAHKVAQHFDEEKRLGCGIFLDSSMKDCKSQTICGTMVRELAQYHPTISAKMDSPIRTPGIASADMRRQFEMLIVKPLEDLTIVGPVLVIIDGLDNCQNSREHLQVLKTFADESLVARLPLNIRFLITARYAQDIVDIFASFHHITQYKIPNNPALQENHDMIGQTLIDLEADKSLVLKLNGMGIDELRRDLMRRAAGDRVWGNLICKALRLTLAHVKLRTFLGKLLMFPYPKTTEDSIGQLYTSILQALLLHQAPPANHPWNQILHALLVFRTDTVFSCMSIEHQQNITEICNILRCLEIITVPGDVTKPAKLNFTTPFEQFLTDHKRCIDSRLYVNRSMPSDILAERCLDEMNNSLHHNMCRLQLQQPSILDTENDLQQRVEIHIPETVQYSTKNWMTNVLRTQHLNGSLMRSLDKFLFRHLLHWIEVLSVIGCLDEDNVCRSLQLLNEHISSYDEDGSHSNLCRMIKDSISFLRSYGSTILQAHLHTYISALPLFPSHTLLHQTYIGEVIDERPQISSNIAEVDPLSFVKRHSGDVNSVTFSLSGSQLVSCGKDKTVGICNAKSGEEVHKMEGHPEWVLRAVFSPDGQRVASCGVDSMIHIWDVQTGQLLNKLAHKGYVRWVEFSLDGSKLVSRSNYDIITWKSDTGDVIAKRQISTSWPRATFSPDGQQVATTSYNKILIFDFKLENQIAVLNHHKDPVQQIAWSLDGSKLASSSYTETLLWDAKQKSLIAVLDAKAEYIKSLRFTANQLSLVTTIFDRTLLHAWDINTSNFNCLTKLITCQNISSTDVRLDLGRILAGTEDGDILMWDIESLQTLSPKDIDDLLITSAHTPTITFHKPFHLLRLAHHVDTDGWLCTQDGHKIVWVSKRKPSYNIRCSTGKLEFLDHKGKIRLVMESSSIE